MLGVGFEFGPLVGGVSERLNEPASKAGRRVSASWVRIPPPPPRQLAESAKVYICGGMSERLKEHAWRACRRVSVSWVQIPLPPPYRCFVEFASELILKFGRAKRGDSGAL